MKYSRVLALMSVLMAGLCGCRQGGQKSGGDAPQTINEIFQEKCTSLYQSSQYGLLHSDVRSRTVIYVEPPKTIHTSVLSEAGWQDEETVCRYDAIDRVVGTGNDIVYVLCNDNGTRQLASISFVDGEIQYNSIRDYVEEMKMGDDPDKITLLCTNGSSTDIVEASVSQGTLVENVLFKDIWLAWNDNNSHDDNWDEAIMGCGDNVLIGTGRSIKIKDDVVSDSHSWSMNEIEARDELLSLIFVWNRADNTTVTLKSLIDAARDKVPASEKITSISPFSITYGGGRNASVHLISVFSGTEYSQPLGFSRLANSAKLVWYTENNALNSINLLNGQTKQHASSVDVIFYSSYIKLTYRTNGNIRYLDYCGNELDKTQLQENRTLDDGFFEWR